MNEVATTSAVPGMRLATVQLIDAMKKGVPGDTYTDEELKVLCRRDTRVNGDGYTYLASAIKHCRNNYEVVWQRIKGAGCIKCLAWNEVGESVDAHRRGIHRSAKVAAKKISTVALADVPEDARVSFLAKAAMFGTLAMFSGKNAQNQLEARKVSKPLDLKGMLEKLN